MSNNSKSAREEFLEEVAQCILKDRNATYGDPEDNFEDTADIWNVVLGKKLNTKISITDVAAMMIGLKLARYKSSPLNVDHMIDMGGYSGCGYACQLREFEDQRTEVVKNHPLLNAE